MQETWKDIKGFENLYKVNQCGQIKARNGKTIAEYNNGTGYKKITLYKDGKGYKKYIHRIVAEAFINNPEAKPQVNHIDGDKTNNAVTNLEWCNQSENMQHAYRTGLQSRKRHKVAQIDKAGKQLNIFKSTLDAERQTGIRHEYICFACNSNNMAGGFKWQYQ